MPGLRLFGCVLLLAVNQQAAPPPAAGLIVGQVVDAGNGRPIAGVVVTITAPPPPIRPGRPFELPAPPPRILTGTDGRFVFRDLPRGAYTITAQRPGHADGAYARRRPGGPSRPLTLADGERVGDVTIRMWRHGAITGTVVDEAGEPAVGLTVRTWRSTLIAGRRRFTGAISTLTDDRGIYRLGNLVPGEYLVIAPIRNVAMPVDLALARVSSPQGQAFLDSGLTSEIPGRSSVIQVRDSTFLLNRGAVPLVANDGRLFVYPTTYYPSATAANQATPVAVASGEERSAIDFQLRPVQTSSVSGTVVGPEGPRAGTQVRLWPADADDLIVEQDSLTAISKANGAFEFPAVPIGNYVLRLHLRLRTADFASTVAGRGTFARSIGGEPVPPLLWAEMPVAVGKNDVTGLDVTLRTGLRISGRVEFEGATRKPFPNELQQVPVVVDPAEGTAFLSSPPAPVDAGGNFTTTGHAPGRYLLRIGNSPSGWMFKSAMHGGRDIADTPFDLTEDISGVVITFTNRWTGIQGTVRTRQGTADGDATIVVFPVDADAWGAYGMNPRRIKSARATGSGTYVVNSVPPGEYFVAALSEEQSADWQDPKFLEALARVAARVTVYEGEKTTQDLRTREVR